MDIIKLGWSDVFAVTSDFDLNQLRNLIPVKNVNSKYIPDDRSGIDIEVNAQVVLDKDGSENVELREAIQERERYSKYWQEEQKKTKAVEEKLETLKEQLEGLTVEETEDEQDE